MNRNAIPTKINKYNVYAKGNKLLGRGDEMELPKFETSGETVSGAGLLGEIEDPTVGYFTNQTMDVPFRVLDQDAVDMLDMTKAVQLEIRGAQQTTDSEGNIVFRSMRVVVRGRANSFTPGKLKNGSTMDTAISISVLYILIELDGESMVELDKLNEGFKIRGVDQLADIKEMS